MKLRVCKNSPKGRNRFARELAEAFPGLDIKVKGCVKQCRLCREQPFVMIDGTALAGATWEELKTKIESLL